MSANRLTRYTNAQPTKDQTICDIFESISRHSSVPASLKRAGNSRKNSLSPLTSAERNSFPSETSVVTSALRRISKRLGKIRALDREMATTATMRPYSKIL